MTSLRVCPNQGAWLAYASLLLALGCDAVDEAEPGDVFRDGNPSQATDGEADGAPDPGGDGVDEAPGPHDAAVAPDAAIDAPLDAGAPPGPSFPPTTGPDDAPQFPTTMRGNREGPDCVVHRPATLGEGGRKHPVLIWGMGTGGFNTYGATFERWAGQGFVVAAATLGDGQGDGAEMLACLDHVCTAYAPNVDCTRVGASGHSQGGGGALMAGRDPRVLTTAPIQPYTEQGFGGFDQASFTAQQGPVLLLSGTNDTVATPSVHQQPVFDAANVPVFWANLVGGNHVVTGIDGAAGYREITLAWFRLQLMGDESQRAKFHGAQCTYCTDSAWQVMRRGLD